MKHLQLHIASIFAALFHNFAPAQANYGEICSLPLRSGPCEAYMPSWGFKNGECVEFIYGGCNGNDNNFGTRTACEEACLPSVVDCEAPLVTGNCKAAFRRWGSSSGVCEEFIYGGCGGNSNNFRSQAECETACPPADLVDCNAPLETGNCRASIPRWGSRDGKCEQFTYGGCGGNSNNFQSLAECREQCPETHVDVCTLPQFTGPCRAGFKRWGFDTESGRCTIFTYGGCQSNGNNFNTEEECNAQCPPTQTDVCQLPLETGPCKANKTMWGFSKGKCRKFTYGGCQGNANRFTNKRACKKRCHLDRPVKKPRKCRDSSDRGSSCAHGTRRWLYNSVTNTCEKTASPICSKSRNSKYGFKGKKACVKRCVD